MWGSSMTVGMCPSNGFVNFLCYSTCIWGSCCWPSMLKILGSCGLPLKERPCRLLNYALAKSVAFLGAGLVLITYDHMFIALGPGLQRDHPAAGVALVVAG